MNHCIFSDLLNQILNRLIPCTLSMTWLLLAAQAAASSATVSNVRSAQIPGTHQVEILYDLTNQAGTPVEVAVQASTDGGATYAMIPPAAALSGHVGAEVEPGTNRKIVFNASMAGGQMDAAFTRQLRFQVQADGGSGLGSGNDEFVLIPAGNFTMGRTIGDLDGDRPPVSVYVSDFYMAKCEVTKALWDKVRTWGLANGYSDLPTGGGKAVNHPVHSNWWHEVVKWCNARSEKDGLTPCYTVSGVTYKIGDSDTVTCNRSASGYRLPTEAEWEKAARGGWSGLLFPWGDTISHSQANYESTNSFPNTGSTYGYHPNYNDGVFPYTSPVGSFTANSYGLHDMAGNVSEWCWDWYSASYYTSGTSDPRGPASGTNRVIRGGNWKSRASECLIYGRNYFFPSEMDSLRSNREGFRLARSSVP